jgi:hypothetical protein
MSCLLDKAVDNLLGRECYPAIMNNGAPIFHGESSRSVPFNAVGTLTDNEIVVTVPNSISLQ